MKITIFQNIKETSQPFFVDISVVLNRIQDFWTELQTSLATQSLNRIVIITHNAATRILLGYLNEIPLENYRKMRSDNCSVSKILC